MSAIPFGLDIGATVTKAVFLEHIKNAYTFRTAMYEPTPPKGMLSESPLDQKEMADAIRKLVNDAKITTPYVNIALPESQVYTRVITMPVLSDKELTSAIYWEAEQYIPVPLTTVVLDYKVLQRPKQVQANSTMDVLLVGAPTALVDKYQNVLQMAGLEIVAVETEILSAVRALVPASNAANAKTPSFVIIHIGVISTSLAIVKDGVVVFTYTVPTGGMAINRAISTDFGFTVEKAEEYKKMYGVSNQNLEGKIGQATTPILMSIIGEVKKAIAFFNDKYKNESQIQQIILSGGTAKLPSIDLFFAQNCGIETVIANPWSIVAGQPIPQEAIDNAPDYSIAVGLAMRDYE